VHGIAPPATPTIKALDNPRDTDTEYTFEVVTVDPNDDPIKYVIDWGDGTITTIPEEGYYSSGKSVEVVHSYSETGDYSIKVKAIDCDMRESNWSSPLNINIWNHRPKVTHLDVMYRWPNGDESGVSKDKIRRFLQYYYRVWSDDPDDEGVKYFIWFEDEQTWHESEFTVAPDYEFPHRFLQPGNYTVIAKCEDAVGAMSTPKKFYIHVINLLPDTPSNPSPANGATIYTSTSSSTSSDLSNTPQTIPIETDIATTSDTVATTSLTDAGELDSSDAMLAASTQSLSAYESTSSQITTNGDTESLMHFMKENT